ncbi:MAG: fucose isomerase [Planctomycetes bacterium GWF2_41_51]|nr:MAG: fucose isomerase [Planctomycetes bacterium GWF2_41_51]HBG26865.1 fucose isomerase [Phycisphaerales bacterium]
MAKMTFGVIVGNRGFFPASLAQQGRQDILNVLKKAGCEAVCLTDKDTKFGSVETYSDAQKCAELFDKNADKIDGIIVTLPNFGDEKGVAEVIKSCGLNVPILIQAESDDNTKMKIENRRDSFCGKISVCNNLRQSGVPFTLTKSHTMKVKSLEFKKELDFFASVCRIVKGLNNVRFGAIGARTGAFNTVRYSEKILELAGISVETIDLSEIFGRTEKMDNSEQIVKQKIASIQDYVTTSGIPDDALMRMAKFSCVIDQWASELNLAGTAIQCWTSMEEFFGVVPCTIMSMMSQSLMPSACEVDITGLLAMYILQLASGSPSALLDWNNNFGNDPDKCVLFHCSNLPKSFFKTAKMDYQAIIAGSVGKQNTYGTIVGKIAPNKTTFCRVTTDDTAGILTGYVGQGEFTADKLNTFGGYGILKVKNLQTLLQLICQEGFEHHVAANISSKADAITEALENYLGWEIYHHQ